MVEYDAVLFDNDGVLVVPPGRDTQAAATRSAFQAVGIDEPLSEHVMAIVDGVTVDRLREICRHYDVDPERFWAARERLDERSQLTAFKEGVRGCYDDVSAITDFDRPRGIVSNNHHSTIAFLLEFFEIEEWFDIHRGRPKTIESLTMKKPDPHYLEQTLEKLDATSALYVGDSQSDVTAAHRADIDSAFVRRPHCRNVDLDPTPTYDVSDLHEILSILTA
ncbi:MAG: HAD family hydrolase [Halobacteriales archaeon]